MRYGTPPVLVNVEKKLGHRFKKRRVWANVRAIFLARALANAKQEAAPNTLLIVRVDRIGDYLLFRDFLRVVRQSERFKNFRITLCGNVAFKELAENFDAPFVDEFIWIDRAKFEKRKDYFLATMLDLYQHGFAVAVQPTFSRDIFGDLLVYACGAPERIGVNGDTTNQTPAQRQITDTFYTELLNVDAAPRFEFERNEEIMQALLGRVDGISLTLPAPKNPTPLPFAGPYAVIAPGSSSAFKSWDKFAPVAEFLRKIYKLEIVFIGKGKRDRRTIQAITRQLSFAEWENCCDKFSLVELASLVKQADIVIGNDSAAIHLAALLRVPMVCPSPGAHAFRFNNYPPDFRRVRFVFPPELEKLKESPQFQHHAANYADGFSVADISVAQVQAAINEVLVSVE